MKLLYFGAFLLCAVNFIIVARNDFEESIKRGVYDYLKFGSYVVNENGWSKITKTKALINPDEFEFDGIYKSSQGTFRVRRDIIYPLEVENLYANSDDSFVPKLWPNNTVTYKICEDVTPNVRDRIHKAAALIETHSCLTFKEYNPNKHHLHKSFIVFRNGPVCASMIGYNPSKNKKPFQQDVYISDLCSFGSVLHLLMHILGFKHEESRKDSSMHVKLLSTQEEAHSFSSKIYDLFSIMHSSESTSLSSKDPMRSFLMGQRETLSFEDRKALNSLYQCSKHCAKKKCYNGGFIDKRCRCQCPDGFTETLCTSIEGANGNTQIKYTYKYADEKEKDNSNKDIEINRKFLVIPLHTCLDPSCYSTMKPIKAKPESKIIHTASENNMKEASSITRPAIMIYYHHSPKFNIVMHYDKKKVNEYSRAYVTERQQVVNLTVPYFSRVTVNTSVQQEEMLETSTIYENEGNDFLSTNLSFNFTDLLRKLPDVKEDETIWVDQSAFKLDSMHPLNSMARTLSNQSTFKNELESIENSTNDSNVSYSSTLMCTFDNDAEYCPVAKIFGWRISSLAMKNFTGNASGTFAYFKKGFVQSNETPVLRIGPIYTENMKNVCLHYSYMTNIEGAGGISTYFLNSNDRRQGSVFGWMNGGVSWYRNTEVISQHYINGLAATIYIEFVAIQGWDSDGILAIDNITVTECSNSS